MLPAIRTVIRVTDQQGNRVSSAEFRVIDASDWNLTPHSQHCLITGFARCQRVFDLAPGAYGLRITAPGFREHASALVVPFERGVLTVRLAPR